MALRVTQRGAAPARALRLALGGWDGRLVLAGVLGAAGAAEVGYLALAVLVGIVTTAAAIHSWLPADTEGAPEAARERD